MKMIESFPVKDIVISEDFKHTDPAAWKIKRKVDYYEQYGELPEDIIINSENVLIDGYTTYLTARMYDLEYVPVKVGYVELIEASHQSGKKSYMWKVPPGMYGIIREGDRCIVRTGSGVRSVLVQKVLQLQYPIQKPRLRNVIRMAVQHG